MPLSHPILAIDHGAARIGLAITDPIGILASPLETVANDEETFNRINELVPGDEVNVFTPQGKFTYQVIAPPEGLGIERGEGWYTVRPDDVSVLRDFEDDRITLTACHPKYSAKHHRS